MDGWYGDTDDFGYAWDDRRLTINAAFLQEIKQDNVHFNQLLKSIATGLSDRPHVRPRVLAELLTRLRDELETHFALEEFYGYFDQAAMTNPEISRKAERLKDQHEALYVELNDLVEEAERLVYHETPAGRPVRQIVRGFHRFHERIDEHEAAEMELIMRLANEEIGVGD